MKKLHFPILAVAVGLLLSANTCNGDKANLSTMEGKWVLEKLNGETVKMPEGKELPYLSVDSLGENVTGFAGCNRIFGPVKIAGDSISFDGLASTRMYCTETQQVEDAFLNALNQARTFSMKNGKLELLGKGSSAILAKE